jgi:hypothetical protein
MFPFGFSLEELCAVAFVLTVAGGYRSHFLGACRHAGVFVGRTVGFIRQKRDQVFTSKLQKREIESLHQQISAAMSELQQIRYGIRTTKPIDGSHFAKHGPEMSTRDSGEKQSVDDTALSAPYQSETKSKMPSNPRESAAPFNIVDPLNSARVCAPQRRDADEEQGKLPRELFEQIEGIDPSGRISYIGGVRHVPISAKDVMPADQGSHTGSHIAKDALLERKVAEKASSIFGEIDKQM